MVKLQTDQPDASLRVLIIDTPGYPADRQRRECAAYAHGLEFTSFKAWVDHARGDDRLVVASLRLLAFGRKQANRPKRPIAILTRRLAEAQATKGVIIEASSGARSDDRKTWPKAVEAAHSWLRSGRMTRAEAKRRASAGGKKGGAVLKARSAPQRWAAVPALLRQCRVMWKSREFANDAQAWHEINAMLVREGHGGMVFGSLATIRRVLGKRT